MVEVEVVKYTREALEVRVRGEGHTLLNLLVDELNRMEGVTAAYRVEHPLLGVASLLVRTSNGVDPLEALRRAEGNIREKLEDLKAQIRGQLR